MVRRQQAYRSRMRSVGVGRNVGLAVGNWVAAAVGVPVGASPSVWPSVRTLVTMTERRWQRARVQHRPAPRRRSWDSGCTGRQRTPHGRGGEAQGRRTCDAESTQSRPDGHRRLGRDGLKCSEPPLIAATIPSARAAATTDAPNAVNNQMWAGHSGRHSRAGSATAIATAAGAWDSWLPFRRGPIPLCGIAGRTAAAAR